MNSFRRVIRLALEHRATLITSCACSLLVAVLWGGNITAVYPMVELVLRGDSAANWVDEKIEYGEGIKAEQRDLLVVLNNDLKSASADQVSGIASEIEKSENRIVAEDEQLAFLRWLQPYLHQYMPSDPFQTLLLILAAFLIGTVIKDIFLVGSQILVSRLSQLVTLDLRTRFFDQTLQMDLAQVHQNSAGDLTNRFTEDINSVSGGVQILFGKAVREPLKMAVCVAGAAWVSWRLLLITLIVVPIAAYLMDRLAKSLKRANRRAMEEMSNIFSSIGEVLSGIKVVKAFTMEEQERSRFGKTANEFYRRMMKIARYDSLIRPLNEISGTLIISIAVLTGGYLSLAHETHLFGIMITPRRLETGSCLLFFAFLAGATDPARKLSDVFGALQRAAAASDRVFETLDCQKEISEPASPVPFAVHHQQISFENICFSYNSDQEVLQGIDLDIAFGETIAIVGPNGCGKSTLASLVLRFFDPQQGSVKIDGIDVRQMRLRDLRSQIGLVSQETLLFDNTVAENIRYGSPEASDSSMRKAAQQAHADRFIREKLADGYDTQVGPDGRLLSGGQRQRLALARAILRDPAILILDEATSQIDLESELSIHDALKEFKQGRTTLIITHRLSTLELANRIVVMDHGRVLDVGTHLELLDRCDFYRNLHQIDHRESA